MHLSQIVKKYTHLQMEIADLEIPESEIVLILGESGCGKSTLLQIISGFLEVDSGHITDEKKTALMLQNPMNQVIMSTVMDELSFPLKNEGMNEEERTSHVEKWLAVCKMEHLRDRKMSTLSFGETQWIMLMATLFSPAGIFCLDEPTSHLDSDSVRKLYKLLKTICGPGHSFLITSQNPDEYIFAHRIWIMEKGRIIQDLSQDEFLSYSHGRDCEPDRLRVNKIVESLKSGEKQ